MSISAMNRTPTTLRHTAPSPPRMLVPPMTTPAITVNVRLSFAVVWSEAVRPRARARVKIYPYGNLPCAGV